MKYKKLKIDKKVADGCSFCGWKKPKYILVKKRGNRIDEVLYLCRYHYKLYKKGYDPRYDYSEADYQTWLRL